MYQQPLLLHVANLPYIIFCYIKLTYHHSLLLNIYCFSLPSSVSTHMLLTYYHILMWQLQTFSHPLPLHLPWSCKLICCNQSHSFWYVCEQKWNRILYDCWCPQIVRETLTCIRASVPLEQLKKFESFTPLPPTEVVLNLFHMFNDFVLWNHSF